jgi:hypothetical protein
MEVRDMHYSLLIQWEPQDAIYVVTVPELPGCTTHGATYEEARRQGRTRSTPGLSRQGLWAYLSLPRRPTRSMR